MLVERSLFPLSSRRLIKIKWLDPHGLPATRRPRPVQEPRQIYLRPRVQLEPPRASSLSKSPPIDGRDDTSEEHHDHDPDQVSYVSCASPRRAGQEESVMKDVTKRRIVRWIHIIFSIPILGYIYSPFEDLPMYASRVRFVVVPLMLLSGLWMWKGHLLRRLGSKRPAQQDTATKLSA